MTFWQRLGLIVYFTMLIIVVNVPELETNISDSWATAWIIIMMITLNLFILPTKDKTE